MRSRYDGFVQMYIAKIQLVFAMMSDTELNFCGSDEVGFGADRFQKHFIGE